MGNYSQSENMVWIRGIWITTQSDNTISPPNKDKMLITNMQIAFRTMSRVQSTTNYEGDEVDLGDDDGDNDGADVDGDEDASPTPRRSAGDDGFDFPFSGGLGAT